VTVFVISRNVEVAIILIKIGVNVSLHAKMIARSPSFLLRILVIVNVVLARSIVKLVVTY